MHVIELESKMVNKKIEIYYPEDTVLNVYPKPAKYLKNSYIRCFSQEIVALSKDKNLSGNDLRVLLAIIGNLSYDNIVNISQSELGKQSDINQQAISKSIKKLTSKSYLKVIDTIGRRNIYMVNPNLVFRSRAKNLKELKQSWDKASTPNTQKFPMDIDKDLEPDLQDKLDNKATELSQQFDIPESKARQIILSLASQAVENEDQDKLELPY